MFHRWEKYSGEKQAPNISELREEAKYILDECDGGHQVNGIVSYGKFDERKEALDNTRHTLCIAGNEAQGAGEWLFLETAYKR